jgi:hypothetical protein
MPFTFYVALVLLVILVALQAIAFVRGLASGRAPGHRHTLPLNNNGAMVKPGTSICMKVRGTRAALSPQYLFISRAGGGNPHDWLVNDVSIDGRSQFPQCGALPGDMFSSSAIDPYISWEMVPRFAEVAVTVSYIGTNPEGSQFWGSLTGVSLTDREAAKRIRRMKRREKLELAAYTRLKAERARAQEVAKARLEAEALVS